MAFAYFMGHMFKTGEPVWHPLNNGGTSAILFCFTCLYLASRRSRPLERRRVARRKCLTFTQRACIR